MWYHYVPVSLPFMFVGVFSGTFCQQTHSPIRIMGVGCFAMKSLYDILVYTNCWEMMTAVGIDGSSSLLFMMYVMVWHFVSNSHKIMTTLMVVLVLLLSFLCNLIDFLSGSLHKDFRSSWFCTKFNLSNGLQHCLPTWRGCDCSFWWL